VSGPELATDPVLKKLLWKRQSPVLLLHAPPEFAPIAAKLSPSIQRRASARYAFVLAFAKSLAELAAIVAAISGGLADDALLWLAYPKGTSKRYPRTDIQRDSLHARMAEHGYRGVTLVAIDADWSAMRFKRT
jgi:hypothetical protein